MADDLQFIYWDACCFLHYLDANSEHRLVLEAILDEVAKSKGKTVIVTSVVSRVEVAYSAQEKAGRLLDRAEEENIDKLWADDSVIKTVDLHELIVKDARTLIRSAMLNDLPLQAADSIHLATAARMEAQPFCTYDIRLLKAEYASLTGLAIMQPQTDTPRLL